MNHRRNYDPHHATRRMRKNRGFIERLIRARAARRIHRIRSNLRRQKLDKQNLSKDIDKLEKKIRDAELRADDAEDENRRLTLLLSEAEQTVREKGSEVEILQKQVSGLAEIIERDRLRVKSEMRVYTDIIEGNREAVNPGRIVADRLRDMS